MVLQASQEPVGLQMVAPQNLLLGCNDMEKRPTTKANKSQQQQQQQTKIVRRVER